MPQSLANLLVHLVFSTKNRQPLLSDPEVRKAAHRYLGGTCNGLDCPVILVGGTEDHVHILARQARTISVADWVKALKQSSTACLRTEHGIDLFQWQAGYGAFSVSQSLCARVELYIDRQEEHHRTQTYQEELRELLRKHDMEFDERYVWD